MESVIAAAIKTDYLRSFEESLVIKEYLSKQEIGKSLLAELLTGQVNDICRTISFATYEADAFIYRQGDSADSMYVLLTGNVNLTHGFSVDVGQGKKEERQRVVYECSPGMHFGDEIVSSDNPRPNSAVCVARAQLLVIKKAVYKSIVCSGTFKDEQASGNVKKGSKGHIMNILSKPRKYRTEADVEALTSYLEREIPFFKKFSTDQILELSRVVEGARFVDKQLLFREGSVGIAFYIVVTGHITIYELPKPKESLNDVEMSMLRRQPSFNRSGASTPGRQGSSRGSSRPSSIARQRSVRSLSRSHDASDRHVTAALEAENMLHQSSTESLEGLHRQSSHRGGGDGAHLLASHGTGRESFRHGSSSRRLVRADSTASAATTSTAGTAATMGGMMHTLGTARSHLSLLREESGSPHSPHGSKPAGTSVTQPPDTGRNYRTVESIQNSISVADFGERANLLGVGKGFGERALENEAAVRMGTVVTGEEITELLIISKTDYLNLISVIRNTKVMEKISLLRKTNLFKNTDVVYLRSISRIMNPVKYAIDEVIYRSGQKIHDMIFIGSGEAQVEVDVEVQEKSVEKKDFTRLAQPFKRWKTTKFVPTDTPSRTSTANRSGSGSGKDTPQPQRQSGRGAGEKSHLGYEDSMQAASGGQNMEVGKTHRPFSPEITTINIAVNGENQQGKATSGTGRALKSKRLESVMQLGRVGPGSVLASSLTLGTMADQHDSADGSTEIFHTETAVASTSITGYTISKNDFFYHLEYDTRAVIADIVRNKLQNPFQLPHLWDDAPKILTDGDWRRKQAWNLFRSDLISKDGHKKDIVGTFRSLSNCELIKSKYADKSGIPSGATVTSEPSADAILFGSDDPAGKAVVMKRFGPSPIVEQVRKNQQKGSMYVLDVIKTNQDRIKQSKHNLVFFPDANQPTTPGRRRSQSRSVLSSSPLHTSPTATATQSDTESDNEQGDWDSSKMSEAEIDGRSLSIANNILTRVKSDIQAKASSYVKDVMDPDREQARMVKFPFSLIHIHREQMGPHGQSDESAAKSQGKGGVRRLMRCHMRICGLMKTPLAAKECAGSQMKNVLYTALGGDHKKEQELKLEWKTFSGFEGMPLQHTDHFLVYCRSAPLEYASLTPTVDLLKQVYPSGCRIKDQSYACFTMRSLSNSLQAADPSQNISSRPIRTPGAVLFSPGAGAGGYNAPNGDNTVNSVPKRRRRRVKKSSGEGSDDDTDSDESTYPDIKALGSEMRSISIVTGNSTSTEGLNNQKSSSGKFVQPMFLLEVSALCEVIAAAPSRTDCLKFAFSAPEMLSRADPQAARLLDAASFELNNGARPDSPAAINNMSPSMGAVGRICSPLQGLRSSPGTSRAQSPGGGGFAPIVPGWGNSSPGMQSLQANAQSLSLLSSSQVGAVGSGSSGTRTCIAPLYEWFLVNEETLKAFDIINSTSKAFAMKAEAAKDTTSMDAQILEQKKDIQMRRSLHEAGLLSDMESPPLSKKLGGGALGKMKTDISGFRSKMMTGNDKVDEKIVASISMKSLEQDVARKKIQREVDKQLAGKLASAAAAGNQRNIARSQSPQQNQGMAVPSNGLLSPTGFLASISSAGASVLSTSEKPSGISTASLELSKKSAGMLVAEDRIEVLKAVMETRKKALDSHSSLCFNEKNGLPDKNGREALLARLAEKKRQAQLETLATSSLSAHSYSKMNVFKARGKSGTVDSDSDISDPEDGSSGIYRPHMVSKNLLASMESVDGNDNAVSVEADAADDEKARAAARRQEKKLAKQMKAKQEERERQKNLKPQGLDMDPTFLNQRAELFETLCGLPSRDAVEQAVRARLTQQGSSGTAAAAISATDKRTVNVNMVKPLQSSRTQAGAKGIRRPSFGVESSQTATAASVFESALTTNMFQTSVNMAVSNIRSVRKAAASGAPPARSDVLPNNSLIGGQLTSRAPLVNAMTATPSNFNALPMTEKLSIKLDVLGEMLQKASNAHLGATV